MARDNPVTMCGQFNRTCRPGAVVAYIESPGVVRITRTRAAARLDPSGNARIDIECSRLVPPLWQVAIVYNPDHLEIPEHQALTEGSEPETNMT